MAKIEGLNKDILASAHINFLFGAGINGSALPQLVNFNRTAQVVADLGGDLSSGLEIGIDSIESDEDRERVKEVFIDEFKDFHKQALDEKNFNNNQSIMNFEKMLIKSYLLVQEAQNRNPSMKQINIYTLNYDEIVDKILAKQGYLYNNISASNNASQAALLDIIGYNYKIRKYIPTFMISKLHGDINTPIIPGKRKYEEILTPNYFEVAFNMKEQLCRNNSVLFVIGYSGRDDHINRILDDCLKTGLTVYWYKYKQKDFVPFEDYSNVFIREQDDQNELKDTSYVCYRDMEEAWAEK